jgi:hypothetical protein
LSWLEDLLRKKEVTPQGYVGLRRELHFYHRFAAEWKLTVAADTGDHCDFAGVIEGTRPVRIDVTSRADMKREQLDHYLPFLREYGYVVVELKEDFGDPVYFPLGPPCPEDRCGGRIYDIVAVDLPGLARFEEISEDQSVIRACSSDTLLHSRILCNTHWRIESSGLVEESLSEGVFPPPKKKVARGIREHFAYMARFFASEYNIYVGAIAECGTYMFGHDDEETGGMVKWQSNWAKAISGDLEGAMLDLPE